MRASAAKAARRRRAEAARVVVPRVIAFHDDPPRDESGKLLKRRLRDSHRRSAGRAPRSRGTRRQRC